MKRLDQVLDIGPMYAQQFERNGIRTAIDLAKSDNLPDLSRRTEVPLELLQQWHALALQKVRASRYRHRIALVIAVVVGLGLALEVRTLFQAPHISSQGDALYDQGLYEQAVQRYNKAIELDPNYEVAYANKGSALRMLGRHPDAIVALDKAITLNPQHVWAYNERGSVYYDDEQYEQANADYQKAIELDSADKFAFAHKGSALRMLTRLPEAIKALDKAIELDPQYVWAYNERANVYSDWEKYGRAIVDYDKALELDPKFKFAYGKSFALRKLHRDKEALDALNQAIAIDPQWDWAYELRGSIYHDDLFQYAAAYEDLKKVSELQDTQAGQTADLAEAALTSGRFPEAYDLATKLLADNENTNTNGFDVYDRLTVRFIAISALLLQGNTAQAKLQLQEFITFYKSAGPLLKPHWDYSGTRHFIAGHPMDGVSKRIILDLIKLLEQGREPKDIRQIEQSLSSLR